MQAVRDLIRPSIDRLLYLVSHGQTAYFPYQKKNKRSGHARLASTSASTMDSLFILSMLVQ